MSDAPDYHPVEEIAASPAPVVPGLILLCDHASNAVPPAIGSLGLPDADMERHIAWDLGARNVVSGLAHRLGAGAVLTRFSRLVIDPNRGPKDPTLMMRLYDGTPIPANRNADLNEVAARRAAYHEPYHARIRQILDGMMVSGMTPILISVHSFTPQLRGQSKRPWHSGVLWDRDYRLAGPLLRRLRNEQDLVVGDNEPYLGSLPGDTMWTHGTSRGLPHALIEIRNDLIDHIAGADAWAARLARLIQVAVTDMKEQETAR